MKVVSVLPAILHIVLPVIVVRSVILIVIRAVTERVILQLMAVVPEDVIQDVQPMTELVRGLAIVVTHAKPAMLDVTLPVIQDVMTVIYVTERVRDVMTARVATPLVM